MRSVGRPSKGWPCASQARARDRHGTRTSEKPKRAGKSSRDVVWATNGADLGRTVIEGTQSGWAAVALCRSLRLVGLTDRRPGGTSHRSPHGPGHHSADDRARRGALLDRLAAGRNRHGRGYDGQGDEKAAHGVIVFHLARVTPERRAIRLVPAAKGSGSSDEWDRGIEYNRPPHGQQAYFAGQLTAFFQRQTDTIFAPKPVNIN